MVGILTLFPAGYTPPLTLETFLCVACGWRDTADIILNWMLFLPGGVLMATVFDRKRAVFVAVAFTVAIETLQVGVPGRDPAVQDLIFNTLGALCGALLAGRALLQREQHFLGAAVVVAWLAPSVLLTPMTSSAELYGQWTPVFGSLEKYEGHILEADVGGLDIRSRIFTDKAALDAAITTRQPIVIRLEVGPPPPALAPIFQVYDGERMEILMLGGLGEDLLLRGKNPSRVLGLDQPDVLWPGAMAGVPVGDTVLVTVERGRDSVCMSIDERTRCHLAPSLGDGWGLLLYLEGAPGGLRGLATILWSMGLGLVLGATCSNVRWAAAVGIALAMAGLSAATVSPDVRPDVLHAGLLFVGALLGPSLRRPVARVWGVG